jgi:steroid delta-isomerase-like uncharacterized protein
MNPDLAALVRRHLQAENAHDLEATLATLHPDCAFEDFATGQRWRGHAGATDHYRQWWDSFDVEVRRGPDQRPYVTTDEFYVAEATWHGKHVGPFLGRPPSGRSFVQPFVVILSFRDGLMSGERFHYDLASLLRQIGADPIPALAGLAHRPTA